MSSSTLIFILLAFGVMGMFAGQKRALASVGGNARLLHSRPVYYGGFAAIIAMIPALILIAVSALVSPFIISSNIASMITPEQIEAAGSQSLALLEVQELASEGAAGLANAEADAGLISAAQSLISQREFASTATLIVALLLGVSGLVYGVQRADQDFRARNYVEQAVLWLLLMAASIAILTTVGIVLSMLFETANFFGLHSWTDFFFGGTWAPNFRGDSDLSILPLLWGTLYISLVALLVAVPIGLFSAIYLSEYAPNSVRSVAKPLLEILAGIPTIVYGLFALLTVGPMLVRIFGEGRNSLFDLGWMSGATSVLTAGLVMGIMLIPFVSSLSDDIINAVPQSLRDGALGLGATKSETVRSVILPAALPGIVGAVLLAASRAIGETMIVVMGAGAIAKFSANPLESMTTITTRIVSQLTGDTDFASAETLVAFALGLTLFVLTLGLNVLALYIVRKYREQYE